MNGEHLSGHLFHLTDYMHLNYLLADEAATNADARRQL
jgi:hypothetical protein